MSLPDVSDYRAYQKTTKCYLDGRYFNAFFKDYPGLLRKPLRITLYENGYQVKMGINLNPSQNYINVLKVIVEIGSEKHAELILIDHNNEEIVHFNSHPSVYDRKIRDIIERYLGKWLDYSFVTVMNDFRKVKNEDCDMSGFCTAFVIKFANDYVLGSEVDLGEIKRFVSFLEDNIPIGSGKEQVEYGLFDSKEAKGTAIGALGGLAIGALAGGG